MRTCENDISTRANRPETAAPGRRHRLDPRISRILAASVALLGTLTAAAVPPEERIPRAAEGVGVDQKLGAQLPLDAEFLNSDGTRVKLGDFFDGTRPVVLTLNYFTCPMLCHLQLEDMVKTLQLMKKSVPGDDFRLLTVSFDPFDTPQMAGVKRKQYHGMFDRPLPQRAWPFLVGAKAQIQRLTETVGFDYRWEPSTQEWVHSAVMIICTPDGKVSRYFSLNTDPELLRLSLVEASNGKSGSLFDQLFLWCYHYDSSANAYAPVARKIMSLGGALTLGVLGMTLGSFWLMESRRRRFQLAAERSNPTPEAP
jgi:protein SCO1/2